MTTKFNSIDEAHSASIHYVDRWGNRFATREDAEDWAGGREEFLPLKCFREVEVLPSCHACNEEHDCKVCGYTVFTDAERFDYLDQSKASVSWTNDGQSCFVDGYSQLGLFPTTREAIDAILTRVKSNRGWDRS
jgi:hypothetical protein